MYIYIYILIFVFNEYTYMYMYICIHIYFYVHTYAYTYIYIYMYMWICIHAFTLIQILDFEIHIYLHSPHNTFIVETGESRVSRESQKWMLWRNWGNLRKKLGDKKIYFRNKKKNCCVSGKNKRSAALKKRKYLHMDYLDKHFANREQVVLQHEISPKPRFFSIFPTSAYTHMLGKDVHRLFFGSISSSAGWSRNEKPWKKMAEI